MCGHIEIFGQEIWIDCEIKRAWWEDPGPLIDLRRLVFRREDVSGPHPDPWRVELTRIVQMLDIASQFSDTELANQIGSVVAEAGTQIAKNANIEAQFSWESHGDATSE